MHGKQPNEHPYSLTSQLGFQAISQRWPSKSWKYPAYPPQKRSCAGSVIVAPACAACFITASTSCLDLTLWPMEKSAGLGRLTAIFASLAKDFLGHSAKIKSSFISKKTTAPSSNS